GNSTSPTMASRFVTRSQGEKTRRLRKLVRFCSDHKSPSQSKTGPTKGKNSEYKNSPCATLMMKKATAGTTSRAPRLRLVTALGVNKKNRSGIKGKKSAATVRIGVVGASTKGVVRKKRPCT